MNSHQRRKSMTRRHMAFPLGAKVKDTTSGFVGTVFKHWDERPYICSVKFSETDVDECKLSSLKLLDTHRFGERPWYRDIGNLRRQAEKQGIEFFPVEHKTEVTFLETPEVPEYNKHFIQPKD